MINYTIHTGDNAEILKSYPDNHFDSIVTDPPYGIEFLGKEWDSNTGAMATWQECLRVLKPGGYLLAFSAARTYHQLATNIELAGFEIRDQLMWLYSSGFPKAQDIGKAIQRRQGVEEYEGFVDTTKNAGFGQTDHARVRAGVEWSTTQTQVGKAKCTSPEAQQWEGWKTALKPAHEPIVMARKPFKGSTIDTVLAHGVGALNIDATRVPNSEGDRFPSNVIGEVAGYQKFFYCPKVSRKERHMGFENPLTTDQMVEELGGYFVDNDGNRVERGNMIYIPTVGNIYVHGLKHEYEKIKGKQDPLAHIPTDPSGKFDRTEEQKLNANERIENKAGNNHPTVKPVELMKYLIKLVTPPNGIVLDPFNGSGSTGMAATELGHEYVGCELDPAYVEIAKRRIEAWNEPEPEPEYFTNLFEVVND